MSYTLTLKIDKRLQDRLTKSLKTLGNVRIYDIAVGQALAQGVRTVQEKTPVNKVRGAGIVRGNLRKQWKLTHPGALKYTIENPVSYGVFVEKGHGIIRPKRKKFLRFRVQGGAIVFTKKVRAVKGVFMLKSSLNEIGSRIVKALTDTLNKITRRGA